MFSSFKIARLAKEVASISAEKNFSRRLNFRFGGRAGEIERQVNAILALAEARNKELALKLDELTDARDDAQTANQLMRRLKNELKSRSAERDAALHRAEAANEAKSQFLANMSHEIRTPMHGILGIADVLARTPLEARQQALVQTMIRSGKGLLTIINDVLDFSKIESGQFDLLSRPFSLRVILDDLASTVGPRFEKKGIEFVLRVDDKLPDILMGDAERIKQVLTNLVENGLKFTDEGYVLLDVNGIVTGDSVALSIAVQDTGIGIADDKISSIFEKFNQVDNSSTRRHEGTGLGLAICRMLVTRMDGRLELVSSLGNGTTFKVDLPLPIHEPALGTVKPRQVKAAPAIAEVAKSLAEAIKLGDRNVVALRELASKRLRVLVVEDNNVNQEVAREFLSEMGCDVTIAENGLIGLNMVRETSFDLVLMDCLMPEMDGLTATRLIREFETASQRGRTSIVALTANAFDKDREACRAAGMDDFLAKPFNFEELQAVLTRWRTANATIKAVAQSA